MIEGSCHCAAVRIEIENAPTELTSCNCSICRRLGSLWSYHPIAQVRVTGETMTYRWGNQEIDFHHCPSCGCTTHWTPIGPKGERMGVNTRMMDPGVVAAARVRHLDGADTWRWLDEDPE